MNDKLVFIQELLVFELVFVAVNDDARSWSSCINCVFEILFFGRRELGAAAVAAVAVPVQAVCSYVRVWNSSSPAAVRCHFVFSSAADYRSLVCGLSSKQSQWP